MSVTKTDLIGWVVDATIVLGTGAATYAGWLGAEVTAPIVVGVIVARLPPRAHAVSTVLGPVVGKLLSVLRRR